MLLAQTAHAYMASGIEIPTHFEDELAFMYTRMLKAARTHGLGWRSVIMDEITALQDKLKSEEGCEGA